MPQGCPLASASNRQSYGFGRMVVYRTLKVTHAHTNIICCGRTLAIAWQGTTFSRVCQSVGILVCYSALCCSVYIHSYPRHRRSVLTSAPTHTSSPRHTCKQYTHLTANDQPYKLACTQYIHIECSFRQIGLTCRTIDTQQSGDHHVPMFDTFISHCNAAAVMVDRSFTLDF